MEIEAQVKAVKNTLDRAVLELDRNLSLGYLERATEISETVLNLAVALMNLSMIPEASKGEDWKQ